jgi:uncharacterized protein YegL
MSTNDFWALKNFLKSIVGPQDISKTLRSRIALVSYASSGTIDYRLIDFTTITYVNGQYDELFYGIDALALHSDSGNNVANALQQCHNAFSQQSSDRNIYPNVIVLIADAPSDSSSDSIAQALQAQTQDNAFIVTVGIGSNINLDELTKMASTLYTQTSVRPAVFTAPSFAAAQSVNFINSVVQGSCIPMPNKQSKISLLLFIIY